MASPASSRAPMSSRRSAVSTSKPSPPAPIIEAMITMLSDSMITWLTPTISGARAAGTITRQVSCRGVQPAMRPNSTDLGRDAAQRQQRDPHHRRHGVDDGGDIAATGPKPKRNRIGSR